MDRRTFLTHACACGTALAAAPILRAVESTPDPAGNALAIPPNLPQVATVLADLEAGGDAALLDTVFSRWGHQCFHTRPELIAFAERQRAHFQGYVDYVNSDRARYWEHLDYDPAAGVIKVVSRKFAQCNCPWAQCSRPAKSLCTRCCTAMQAEFFRTMTGRVATVRCEESILLGGERCRTTVRLASTRPA
jgi:hypothetical protein